MKILVACEESQAVTIEMRRLGHEAYSCDIEPCSGGHPEWHIMQDVIPLINGRCKFKTMDGKEHEITSKWDLLICHPPCTYLSNAGARHLWKGHKLNEERYQKGLEAKAFFETLWKADCDRVVVENPVPSRIYELPPYTQTVQPHDYYGKEHPYTKKTCLWERGVKPLVPVPFPVSWTVKMKKKQKETQDILSYHSQAAGCSDKARAKASGGRQPIEECGRTGL